MTDKEIMIKMSKENDDMEEAIKNFEKEMHNKIKELEIEMQDKRRELSTLEDMHTDIYELYESSDKTMEEAYTLIKIEYEMGLNKSKPNSRRALGVMGMPYNDRYNNQHPNIWNPRGLRKAGWAKHKGVLV